MPCTFFYFLFHAGKEHQKEEKKTHQEITHLLNRKYTTPHYTSHPKLRYELGIISFSTEKSTRICTSMRSRYSQTTTSTPYFNNFANFQVLRILWKSCPLHYISANTNIVDFVSAPDVLFFWWLSHLYYWKESKILTCRWFAYTLFIYVGYSSFKKSRWMRRTPALSYFNFCLSAFLHISTDNHKAYYSQKHLSQLGSIKMARYQ